MPNKPTLDAMNMAIMNQKVQKKSAGGKIAKWAFEKLYPNRTYDSLNSAEKSDVTRYINALKSPAVRRRESFSGPTLREQTTSVGQPRIITPVDLYGKPLMPLTGDVSDAGFDLTQIAGIPLSSKVPVQGGSKYTQIHSQRGDPIGWASMETAAKKKQEQAKKIAEQTGIAPYSVFTAMTPESINFSTPVIEAMLGQLHATKPSKAAIAEFNQAMRDKWRSYNANPEFIGIDSSDVINQFRGTEGFTKEGAGDLRKKAVELMSTAKFRDMGFPRYGDVAEAIIDPRLANAERGESGLAIFRSDPNANIIIDPNIVDHFSYNAGIPMDVSEGSMQLKHSIPASILYKNIFEKGRKEGFPKSAAEIKKGNIQRPMFENDILGALMMRNDLYQPTNQEWLDANMNYLRKLYPNEYKDGGAVNMKDGDLVEDLIKEAKSKQEAPVDPFVQKAMLKSGQSSKAQKTIEEMRAEVESNRLAADILRQDIKGIDPREGSERPYVGRSTIFPEGIMRDVAEASYRDIGPSIIPAERQWKPSVTIGRQPSYVSPANAETAFKEANAALDFPSQLVGEAVFRSTGSPLLSAAAAYGPGMIGPEGYVKGSKALANEAAYRIYQAMERGEGPLAGTLAAVAPRKLMVYHGSPHRFPPTEKNPLGEFDPAKIGTGEGAQAYGHGSYLAEVPKVAAGYKTAGARSSHVQIDGQGIQNWAGANRNLYSKMSAAEKRALTALNDASDMKQAAFNLRGDSDAIAALEKLKPRLSELPQGNLYKVDLPDEHIEKMLDWDKPLSEQSPSVRAAINKQADIDAAKYGEGGGMDYYRSDPDSYSGESIYRYLTEQNSGAIPTSEMLREMGIPGIKYLDAASRDAGEGTRNFVVFPGNEHLLNIVGREKKGGVIKKAKGGITSDDLIIEENPLFTITPQMREDIVGKGQPLYQAIPAGVGVGTLAEPQEQLPEQPAPMKKGGKVKKVTMDSMRLALMDKQLRKHHG
jgi:hypothetical protein